MRLTAVILIVSVMQVSASLFGQQITINRKNASLESLLKEIRAQSSYDFFYDGKIIPKNKVVDISLKNADINEALKKILAGSSLSYTIEGKIVTIRKSMPTIIDKVTSLFTRIDIKGIVADEQGKPLPGASVFIKDSQIRTTTNKDGEFFLQNVEDSATVLIGYVGYQPVQRTALPNMGTIQMTPSTSNLKEIEVKFNTGYQEISRERAAGSFAKPDLKVMLNRTSTPNILTRLEGLAPGLTTRGPGGLLVRGQSSLPTGDNPLTTTRPLIVIDGIEFEGNIEQVNPQDVEDITILKDATSASIWGAKAANGVIVITTKKGKAGERLTFNYDGYYAFQGRPDLDYVKRMNSQQFIALSRELFPQFFPYFPDWETVNTTFGNLPHLQIQYDRARNLIPQEQADFKLDSLAQLSNTDQIADLFVRNASTINQTLSVSGGGKAHTFYGSLNHVGTQSNTPGEQYNQYKINLNNNLIINKRITAFINADLTNTVTRNGNTYKPDRNIVPYQRFKDANSNPLNINYLGNYKDIPLQDSIRTIYKSLSRINLDYNPVLEQNTAYSSSNGIFARLVGGVKVNLLKGLDFQGTYGYNLGNTNTRTVRQQDNYEMRSQVVQFTQAEDATVAPVYNLPQIGGSLNTTTSSTRAWTIRNQLVFNRDWKQHQFTLMAGQQATSNTPVTTTATYYGWEDQLQTSRPVDLASLSKGISGASGFATLPNNVGGSEGRIARTTSYFANLGYTFDRKYTLNASWRIDESNLFGRDKSAQNRPVYSIGGKWALGSELFMETATWLSQLDVRLTYGITGNAPFAGAAASYDILTAQSDPNYVTGAGYLLSSPRNTKLTWEGTKVYNAGVDFSIFENRLSGSVDGYIKKTEDLIGQLATSPLSGYDNVIGNYGNLDNKGIDIGLNSINISTSDFSWSTGLTFSYNKNKLTRLLSNPPVTGDELTLRERMVGYPLYTLFIYNYGGLNANGDPQVRLADGTVTSEINVTKPEDILYAGTTQPVWSGGLQNNFQYKSFNLIASIIYSGGYTITNNSNPATNESIPGNNSLPLEFLNRWKAPGDEKRTDIPRYVPSGDLASARNIGYFNQSQRYALNGAYIKLRDITLSYGLPQTLVKSMHAQDVSFRFQVNNLLLWTANKNGIDPEFLGMTRDAQGTISLGAHISF
ncbi:SusC/RagA family TonB-linked outer membrane protein [Chitinophaga sancti]|uniref:SusC/RagA family TonB-linked outer membrane protein n=2 Tax=Chitinophaga sancti TaxID=1004 RepID=A0ABZ0XNA9_9BACT|nr:SusC/RagA family TonB-linked outer membrane protein [Chitinophaga sancti]WQD62315.1 SusC/RagA family TonB-linked outer membrane protein [Chitinophaga sancti]WQG92116.1 SusC/RagA family TonB-linked outer membrane protein [Chitinophaga sancti]